jgi:hypothetical protein
MQLPALKNSTALSSKVSLEDYIRNSTQNLQHVAASMPGQGVPGAVYLKFNGNTGVWELNKEPVDPKDIGRILVPQHGLYELYIEWANGRPLQKSKPRQLLGVHYDEPLSEKSLPQPLSPHLYKGERDGPTYTLGFIGFMLDDGANVIFEHGSGGAKKAFNALGTAATQALVAFGELVHPVIEMKPPQSYENNGHPTYNPILDVIGYVTDERAREVNVIAGEDIITRPVASKAKVKRKAKEGPAI